MRDTSKLRVTAAAEDLASAVYGATRGFPSSERFALTDQMRRAAVSIGANIIEGAHRQGNRAFVSFLHQALGSAAELEFELRIARRLGYGSASDLEQVSNDAAHMKAMLIRLILHLRRADD